MKSLNVLITAVFLASSLTLSAQKAEVNTKASTIVWTGKKIGGSHTGNVDVKSGSLELKKNKIVAGTIVIDMSSISNTDLKDPGTSAKLVGHLKSDDFFGVEKYPEATFKVKESTAFKNGKATLTGTFTIKGNSETLSFDVTKEGNSYKASVDLDRSKFDVRYGSKSFFDNLGDKAINDIFTLDITLLTK